MMPTRTTIAETLVRWGRGRSGVGALLLALALAAGCGHVPPEEEDRPTLEPPGAVANRRFIPGPAGLLFTNVDGFSARITLEPPAGSGGFHRTLAGELFGRGSELAFVPEGAGDKPRGPVAMAVVWNLSTGKGHMASEALQAYALLQATNRFTSITSQPVAGAAPLRLEGHLCQASEATVVAEDGTRFVFRVWRADDLGGLPLQIERPPELGGGTIRLAKPMRLAPPAEVFAIPRGFTAYDDPDLIQSELNMRLQNLRPGGGRTTGGAAMGSGSRP